MNFVADEEGGVPNLQKKFQYDTKSDESDGMSKPSHEIAVGRADITRIERAWNANLDDDEEVIDHSLHGLNHKNRPSIQKGEVTRRHFKTLAPGNWLGDVVINSYIHVLRNICRLKKLKIHWWTSFFFTQVYDNQGFNYKNVKRWAKKQVIGGNIFALEKMYVPINKDGVHWVLIEVDMKAKDIKFYDSMVSALNPDSAMSMMSAIAQYICKEGEKKGIDGLEASQWNMAIVKGSPQQRNGVDCGVFMLQTGRSLMGIGPYASNIPFNQDHIDFLSISYWCNP